MKLLSSKSQINSFFVILCIIFSFATRFFLLDDRGLSGDENYTAIVSQFLVQEGGNQPESVRNPNSVYFTPKEFWAKRNSSDFLEAMARRENGSGALYFLTVHYWTSIFGIADVSLRFPSLLFTLLLLPILFIFTKRHFAFTPYTAYWVTILASISPFYVNYALVARNYAMTFMLVLLATLFFLEFIKNEKREFWKNKYFWLYSITGLAVLFGHHSTIILFPLHLLILLFSRKFNKIPALLAAFVLPFTAFFLWSISEGGKYTYDFIQNSTKQYLEIAKSGSDPTVLFSSPKNIISRFAEVFTYLYIPISGVAIKLAGFKNTIICLLSSFILAFSYVLPDAKKRIPMAAIAIIVPLMFYSIEQLVFALTSVGLSLLWVIFYLYFKNFKKFEWQTTFLMAAAPIGALILYAILDGITMRINPRYAGFGYPFTLILVVSSVEFLWKRFNRPIILLVYIALWFSFIILPEYLRIVNDNEPKYFHHVKKNRLENPYKTTADHIIAIYEEGDTVLYPSPKLHLPATGSSAGPPYSLQDAQYVNLYLPKSATFIQRGDTTETDKVYLWKNKLNKKILLMDLSDKRY